MIDPYKAGLVKGDIYASKSQIRGRLVVVLAANMENRGLKLIDQPSRALKKHEIHELIATKEDAAPGKEVNTVRYAGFFEVLEGGVILNGDELLIGGRLLGRIVGYDGTHMPNHQNIVYKTDKIQNGLEAGLVVEQEVVIRKPDPSAT